MNEKIKSEMISRRGTFSLVWKAAAASLAVPAVVMLAASEEAEAQTQASNTAIRDKVAVKIGVISAVIKDRASGSGRTH